MPLIAGTVLETLHPLYEWKIPRFFTNSKYRCIQSPTFSHSNCTCSLRIYVKDVDIWVTLTMNGSSADAKIITFGIKKADDSLQEKSPVQWPRDVGFLFMKQFLILSHLRAYKAVLLPSGTLTVTCRINTISSPAVDMVTSTLMDLETLSSDFKNLFISKKCDVTISVMGKEFQAHRAVLGARSPVFFAMFEHRMSEEETGVITIPDCDPNTFGNFLHYLYTGTMKLSSCRNAHYLYVTADKYNVQGLKFFCRTYMMRNMTVDSVCDVISLANLYADTELLSVVEAFFNKNFNEVFSTAGWKTLMKNDFDVGNQLLKNIEI